MILPTSNILTSWPPTEQSKIAPEVTQNLEKFSKLHHKCYVLVTAPLIGRYEQATHGLLQDHFLTGNIHFLLLHNSKECADSMLSIVKIASKSLSCLIKKRMADLEMQLESEENVIAILKGFGFTERECVMILDGCGGLSGLAQASVADLMDLNFDSVTANRIISFLHSN